MTANLRKVPIITKYYNGKCITPNECSYGYINDNKICIKCKDTFNFYENNSCVEECSTGYYNINTYECQKECLYGYYDDNNNCIICKDINKYYENEICVDECSYLIYQQMNVKIQKMNLNTKKM